MSSSGGNRLVKAELDASYQDTHLAKFPRQFRSRKRPDIDANRTVGLPFQSEKYAIGKICGSRVHHFSLASTIDGDERALKADERLGMREPGRTTANRQNAKGRRVEPQRP